MSMCHFAVILMAFQLVGCSGLREPSRLAGAWGIPVGEDYVTGSTDADGRLVETKTRASEFRTVVFINADGSFDLSKTMLGGLPDFKPLRRVGDRVNYSGGPEDGYLEVLESECSQDASSMILMSVDVAENRRSQYWFKAQLRPDGLLDYSSGRRNADGEVDAYEKAVMARVR